MKKTAIVTGSARGIGFAIAKQLLEDGYNVVVTATGPDFEAEDEFKAEAEKNGVDYLYLQSNVASAEDREELVNKTVEKFGRIDLLVNNAGVAPNERNDILDMTEASFDRVVGINTKGNLFVTQLVAKQMLKQDVIYKKRGTIVNVSSCSAVVSSPNRGEYCVSKAGVSMLTTLFADRLAGDGILVHEVRPGVIATDMTSTVEDKYNKLIEDGAFPIARWGTPEDVANAVSALASDKFLYTTGNYLDIDGGFHILSL